MEYDIEGILLTGGRSSRMGQDKATLPIDGVPLAVRIADELSKVAQPVTVIGRTPLDGYPFVADREQYAGPLIALSQRRITHFLAFVCSCDLPRFDSSVVLDLANRIGPADAAVPVVDGRLQPLCALYRKSAFRILERVIAQGEKRVMTWLESLDVVEVNADDLTRPLAVVSANTPQDLERLLQ